MIKLRKSEDRGHVDHGWLKAYHSFSFGDYRDPKHTNFGPLRVINEDCIQPNSGFDMHGHKNMEIITYVLEGDLTHHDNFGHTAVLKSGWVQVMSAGAGIMHSEFNYSKSNQTHLLQIWVVPDVMGGVPQYSGKRINNPHKKGKLCLIVSKNEEDTLHVQQDIRVYLGTFHDKQTAMLDLSPERLVYVHVIKGKIMINSHYLTSGDALLMSQEKLLSISGATRAEILVFDLPQ